MKKLVIIHTVPATIQGLGTIASEELKEVEIVNILDDSILKDMIAGKEIDKVETRWITYAKMGELMGADMVLSACSTVGDFAEKANDLLSIPVLRIDDAMAEEAVKRGGKVEVFATLSSTMKPTADLIQRKARAQGVTCEINSNLVEGAFEQLGLGNKEEHDQRIRKAVETKLQEADVIVLAQASMASALEGLDGRKVLTSPRSGINMVKERLQ